MQKSIWIEIKGCSDSVGLWSKIYMYGINLTDLDGVTYVYGNVDGEYIEDIISKCKDYGDIEVGGGDYVEEKENKT